MRITTPLSSFVLIGFLLPCAALAQQIQYETNGALERGTFLYTKTSNTEAVTVSDAANDLVVFDRQERKISPSVLADLRSVRYEAGEDGWEVTFNIQDEMPEDPEMAVNFFVYIDVDGNTLNNAPSGVYRTNSDTAYMILHGTKTKWHSKRWAFRTSTGRWREYPEKPEFTIEGTAATIYIPYSEVPNEDGIQMRAFSLTNENGISAIDIAPGEGLPPAVSEEDVPNVGLEPPEDLDQPHLPEGTPVSTPFTGAFLGIVTVLLIISVYFWKRS